MFKVKVLVAIGSLLLLGGVAAQSLYAQSGDECKGKKSDRPAHCNGEDTTGGEHRSLRVTFDDDGSVPVDDDLYGDGSAVYSDSERAVEANLGGQTQPNPPGFGVKLKKKGRTYREITGVFDCEPLPGGPDNCDLLPAGGTVTDDTMGLGLVPYIVNCPRPLPNGECPDVFTMSPGITELMSFRINFWNQGVVFEVASSIGGADAPNPGRCLSLLSDAQRDLFLAGCGSSYACNVSVQAFDNGGLSGGEAGDGENDEWRVDANEVKALLCILQSGYETVYGMTTMTFGVHAIKE